jgi:hypothetical protein
MNLFSLALQDEALVSRFDFVSAGGVAHGL